LNTRPSRTRAVADQVAKLECCKFVAITIGRFDMMVILVGKSRAEIAQIIETKISNIPGVEAIEVREPVGMAKHRYDLIHLTQE
jgi:DNA-binding Lrp family transcriptional regulator